jgi:hypothetical protein
MVMMVLMQMMVMEMMPKATWIRVAMRIGALMLVLPPDLFRRWEVSAFSGVYECRLTFLFEGETIWKRRRQWRVVRTAVRAGSTRTNGHQILSLLIHFDYFLSKTLARAKEISYCFKWPSINIYVPKNDCSTHCVHYVVPFGDPIETNIKGARVVKYPNPISTNA